MVAGKYYVIEKKIIKRRIEIFMKDYLNDIHSARKYWMNKKLEFDSILDKWEDENTIDKEFYIQLNSRNDSQVIIYFKNEVDERIIIKACEDFNLKVIRKETRDNYLSGVTWFEFTLVSKGNKYKV